MNITSYGNKDREATTATVILKSGDSISVAYTAPDGRENIITIRAQHLILCAYHEGTDKSIVCRPSGVQAID